MKFPIRQQLNQLQFAYFKSGPLCYLGKNDSIVEESKKLSFAYLKTGPVIINYSIETVNNNFEDILICFID